MRLPSGKEVSDESLRQVVEALVLGYADYGFEDFGSAIHDVSGYIGNEIFDYPDLLGLDDKDIDAIIEAVEPLARDACTVLGDAYVKLNEEVIEHHVWP